MGRPDEALAAFKAAAKLDASHALECARMHRKRADGLARERERERERERGEPRPGGGARAAGAAAKGGPESGCAEGAAAQLYEEAAGWYYQAAARAGDGSGEAGKGCLECARALDRMGRPDEALAAFKAAAKLDASHALECARMHRKRADELAAAGGMLSKKAKRMYGETLGQYEAAVQGGSGGAQGLYEAAAVCMAAGRHREAAAKFVEACDRDGDAGPGAGGGGRLRAACVEWCCICAGRLAARGNFEGARECLERAITADPRRRGECAGLCAGWGAAERKRGRHAEAAGCFEAALSIDGGNADARFGLADALVKLGRHSEALAQYREAGDRAGGNDAPAPARAWLGMADAYEGLGRRAEAAQCLVEAAKADPRLGAESARRCAGWGAAEYGAGRYAEAAGCFEAAASLDEGRTDARFGLADALVKLGRHDEAIRWYEKAGKCGVSSAPAPAPARAWLGMADAYEGLGRRAEAAQCLVEAAKADPSRRAECGDRCTGWGAAERKGGRHAEAAGCFEAALSIDGGNADARFGLADLLRSMGKNDDALREYSSVRRLGSPDQRAHAYVQIALALAEMSRHAAAAELVCMAAKAAEPAAPPAAADRIAELAGHCSRWGNALYGQERDDGASYCYALALSIDPCSADARTGSGNVMARQGRPGDALEEYGAALKADPRSAGALVGAGTALCELADGMQRAGDRLPEYLRAERKFGEALKGDPNNPGALAGAGRALVGAGTALCELADGMQRAADRLPEYLRAERKFGEALKGDPNNPGALAGAGRALVGAGTALCELADGMQRADERLSGYLRARNSFDQAAKHDPESVEAYMGTGRALVGAGTALCELAKGRQRADDRLFEYQRAEQMFDEALKGDSNMYEARMGAGRALRKIAQLRYSPDDKAGCYGRALEHYDALSGSDSALAPAYWKGVCMLHLGDASGARRVMMEALTRAAPRGSTDLNLCGRICDVFGDYDMACKYYAESLEKSRRYTSGFHRRIEPSRIHEEHPAPLRPSEASAGPATYVLDANVVIECAARDGQGLPSDAVSYFEKIRDAGRCCIPQASFGEAYGVLYAKHGQEGHDMLSDWAEHVSKMPEDRDAANLCMQKAREAMMTAWLYSSKEIKGKWRSSKFGPRSPYCGGPPTGRDVLILATAVRLRGAGGSTTAGAGAAGVAGSGPRRIRLVTSDSDFLHFGRYIREVLSVEVVDPIEAAGLIGRSLREEGK